MFQTISLPLLLTRLSSVNKPVMEDASAQNAEVRVLKFCSAHYIKKKGTTYGLSCSLAQERCEFPLRPFAVRSKVMVRAFIDCRQPGSPNHDVSCGACLSILPRIVLKIQAETTKLHITFPPRISHHLVHYRGALIWNT